MDTVRCCVGCTIYLIRKERFFKSHLVATLHLTLCHANWCKTIANHELVPLQPTLYLWTCHALSSMPYHICHTIHVAIQFQVKKHHTNSYHTKSWIEMQCYALQEMSCNAIPAMRKPSKETCHAMLCSAQQCYDRLNAHIGHCHIS